MDEVRGVEGAKISVIVPVYKVEPYLRKCLDSIVNQTHQNLEIILVDDGSPDNCGAICEEYAARDDRIRVIHKENGGVSSARNVGLDIAEGDWIGFVDPDDWIELDMFEYLWKNAEEHEADVVACGMRKTGAGVSLTFQYKETQIFDREQALRELLGNTNMLPSCCGKLAKGTMWKDLRFSEFQIGEDLLAMGQLLDRADKVICLPEIKYNYLTRPESALTDGSLENRLDCWRAATRLYEKLGSEWPQLRTVLAGRSVAAAIGIWGAYNGEEKERRKELLPEIKKIAAFCREHRQDAVNHVKLGLAGRIVLRMTAYPTWWAFFGARAVSCLYRGRHKRAL